MRGDEVYVEQITVADFNSKLDELFNTTTSKEQYKGEYRPAGGHQRRIYNLMILLKRKRNKLREISKYKCRLVMDGSRQRVGIDVFDTFSPVIDYTTVRMLISIAFGNGWKMFHWDISVAFTNADAHEPTYVMFHQNFPSDIQVCPGYAGGVFARLAKKLYGSKTAPKLWYKCLSEFLIEIGFRSVAGHPCLLI